MGCILLSLVTQVAPYLFHQLKRGLCRDIILCFYYLFIFGPPRWRRFINSQHDNRRQMAWSPHVGCASRCVVMQTERVLRYSSWHVIPNHALTFGHVLAPPVPYCPILSRPFRVMRRPSAPRVGVFLLCLRCCCDGWILIAASRYILTLGVDRMRITSRQRKRCSRFFLTTDGKL